MYVCITMQDLGSGGIKSDALRLLLRPIWDRSKATVATWLAGHCIQFLAVDLYVCFAFPLEKVLKVGRTTCGVTSLEGQLSSA